MKSLGHPHKNRLEWLVFAASLLVIASIVGLLVHGGLMTRGAPAQLQVFLGESRLEGSLFVVPVVVENRGAEAAAGVRVEVLLDTAGEVERATFELSYSPGGSIRRGQVAFASDPRRGSMTGRAVGFEIP
jgi:uncharacterized protein (TIGR02588 family)